MYEKFPPTDERDFTLIVNAGLAYRDTMPNECDDKAVCLLHDAKSLVEDKTQWMPHEFDVSDPMSWKPIKAVDSHGSRVNPSSLIAVRRTALGAIECAWHRNYTPESLRIALNAIQLAIQGWISLGYNHDKRRQREQYDAITGLDDYCDDDMARDAHPRLMDIFDRAIKALESVDIAKWSKDIDEHLAKANETMKQSKI